MKKADFKPVFLPFKSLKFDAANRMVNSEQVQILKELVLRHGVLRAVILVHLYGENIIVDGQHLATALNELKQEIPCVVVPCANEEEKIELMSSLNRVANNWKIANYIHAYKTSGNKHYAVLEKILADSKEITKTDKTLKIQDCVLHAIYAGKNRGAAKDDIEKGDFVVVDKKAGDEIVNKMYDCQGAGLPSNSRKANEALANMIFDLTTKGFYNHLGFLSAIANKAKNGGIIFPDNENELKNELRKLHDTAPKIVKTAKKVAVKN